VSVRAADPRLSARVGAAVLVVALAAVVYLLVIRDRVFLGDAVEIQVRFDSVGALQEGAPVLVAGRQIGRIRAIRLVPRGGVIAFARIDARRRHMVPVNGDFFVSSRGIFSDRYLEIGPPRGGAAPDRPVQDGDQLVGAEPPQMDRVWHNTWNNLTIARRFLDEIAPEARALVTAIEQLGLTLALLEPAPGEYARLRANVTAAADQARAAWRSLDDAGARPEQLSALVARARSTFDQTMIAVALVRGELDQLTAELDRLGRRIDAARPALERKVRAAVVAAAGALDQIDGLRAKVDDLLGIVERGEGTIGRIRTDPEFPEDAKELGKILKRRPWRVVGRPQDDEP
jgi:ABC-type transporter Mla subunit MlaD